MHHLLVDLHHHILAQVHAALDRPFGYHIYVMKLPPNLPHVHGQHERPKGDHKYVMKLPPNLPQLHGQHGRLRDATAIYAKTTPYATPSQSMPSTHSTRRTMQIPQLRDEESPSQSTCQPLSVPLTRSRRLSQLLSGIVEVNDNAAAAMTASRKKTPQAQTPYKEAPATESMETHPARKNTKGPSTRST
ncbi:hypothetical protein CJ030_MR5G001862 [Morella rubra]|uniref:Uncharacterized protein n=1 Tax=Morella rubra TaxID=262757 RepID=A0A6A1VPZ2_9ROSI|nr:hypothetical protein CJ030_MR5G001862 [Morella rubra]